MQLANAWHKLKECVQRSCHHTAVKRPAEKSRKPHRAPPFLIVTSTGSMPGIPCSAALVCLRILCSAAIVATSPIQVTPLPCLHIPCSAAIVVTTLVVTVVHSRSELLRGESRESALEPPSPTSHHFCQQD